jgi:hypothetical protein
MGRPAEHQNITPTLMNRLRNLLHNGVRSRRVKAFKKPFGIYKEYGIKS